MPSCQHQKSYFANYFFVSKLPSIDKDRHGFDGQKCVHTASIPLEIRQVFPADLSLSRHISARQNCFAPVSEGFPRDFWLLSRRRADARQGEKDKKRRKGALAGVFALVNRWLKQKSRAPFPDHRERGSAALGAIFWWK